MVSRRLASSGFLGWSPLTAMACWSELVIYSAGGAGIRNLTAVLDDAGVGFRDVVKVTVYLRCIRDRHEVNTVRRRYSAEADRRVRSSKSAHWCIPKHSLRSMP